jgi:predicted exporter
VEPPVVGVASTGGDAERSQAVNSNVAVITSAIIMIAFLDMLSSSEVACARDFGMILAQPFYIVKRRE